MIPGVAGKKKLGWVAYKWKRAVAGVPSGGKGKGVSITSEEA